jgi:hypothetical protein
LDPWPWTSQPKHLDTLSICSRRCCGKYPNIHLDFDGGEGAVGPELSNIADAVQDPDIAISSDGLDFTYATINPDVDLVNPLADENRISVDNTLLGGSTNGTWKLVISETNGGEPGINSSEIWAGQGNGGTIWRIYSDYYVPAAADHVTITKEDGVAKSDDTDTETFTLQIVDATGNPVPYIQNVDVTATGAGTIRITVPELQRPYLPILMGWPVLPSRQTPQER